MDKHSYRLFLTRSPVNLPILPNSRWWVRRIWMKLTTFALDCRSHVSSSSNFCITSSRYIRTSCTAACLWFSFCRLGGGSLADDGVPLKNSIAVPYCFLSRSVREAKGLSVEVQEQCPKIWRPSWEIDVRSNTGSSVETCAVTPDGTNCDPCMSCLSLRSRYDSRTAIFGHWIFYADLCWYTDIGCLSPISVSILQW